MKFEFTADFKTHPVTGKKAFQIRALCDFTTVYGDKIKKGDLGGFLSEDTKADQDEKTRWWAFEGGTIWGGTIEGGTIRGGADIFVAMSVGSSHGVLTVTRQEDGSLLVNRGCFTGSLDQFKNKVKATHKRSKQAKAYKILISYIEYHFYELHKK